MLKNFAFTLCFGSLFLSSAHAYSISKVGMFKLKNEDSCKQYIEDARTQAQALLKTGLFDHIKKKMKEQDEALEKLKPLISEKKNGNSSLQEEWKKADDFYIAHLDEILDGDEKQTKAFSENVRTLRGKTAHAIRSQAEKYAQITCPSSANQESSSWFPEDIEDGIFSDYICSAKSGVEMVIYPLSHDSMEVEGAGMMPYTTGQAGQIITFYDARIDHISGVKDQSTPFKQHAQRLIQVQSELSLVSLKTNPGSRIVINLGRSALTVADNEQIVILPSDLNDKKFLDQFENLFIEAAILTNRDCISYELRNKILEARKNSKK